MPKPEIPISIRGNGKWVKMTNITNFLYHKSIEKMECQFIVILSSHVYLSLTEALDDLTLSPALTGSPLPVIFLLSQDARLDPAPAARLVAVPPLFSALCGLTDLAAALEPPEGV